MSGPEPLLDSPAQLTGECGHFFRFLVGNDAAHFVAREIAFLAEGIEAANESRVRSYRKLQGVKHTVVVSLSGSAVTRSRERSGGRLQGGIIRDVEPPVGAEARDTAFMQVAVCEREQILDF